MRKRPEIGTCDYIYHLLVATVPKSGNSLGNIENRA